MKKFLLLTFVFSITVFSAFMLCACDDPVTSVILLDGIETEYFVGDDINITNGRLYVTTKSGKGYEVNMDGNSDISISDFSTTTAGRKTAIITYKGQTCLYGYEVSSRSFTAHYILDLNQTVVYDGKSHNPQITLDPEIASGVTTQITFAENYPNAKIYSSDVAYREGVDKGEISTVGVRDTGTYKFDVKLQKTGYQPEKITVTLNIVPKTVSLEFAYTTLSKDQAVANNDIWIEATSQELQNLKYISGGQLFARVYTPTSKSDPIPGICDCDKTKAMALSDNISFSLPASVSSGQIATEGGNLTGIGTYVVKVSGNLPNYKINSSINNFKFVIVKGDVGSANTAGTFASAVKDQCKLFDANTKLSKSGETYSITLDPVNQDNKTNMVIPSSVDKAFVKNADNSVTVTITYAYANFENVVLTRTFTAQEIVS